MGGQIPPWQKAVAIPGMLLFGTCTVVIQKFLFEQKSMGLPEYGEHKFKKPWFQTNSMFIGMCLALAVYEIQRLVDDSKEPDALASQLDESTAENDANASHKKMYFYVAAPAMCDLVATALMNIGLLYIQASVWQMLRGSMVLFSSLFCAFILKRPHYPFMWFAVTLVIIALTIVGVAAVSSTGVGKAGVSSGQVVMAICLTVGSQLIQASQIVVEDFLMHDMTASPVLIVGLEGFWGTLITLSIFLPITHNIKGPEGNGVHEDTFDTLRMIKNNSTILIFVIIYVFVILAYNVTGMFVTNITSAVVRTILEGLRTLCIWVVQLFLFYYLKNKPYGREHPDIGEAWTKWSYMQLAGFALLFTGMLIYNKIIKLSWFKYPEEPAKKSQVINDEPLIAKDN